MKLNKAASRDRKKDKNRMKVSGRSVFTIVGTLIKRSERQAKV